MLSETIAQAALRRCRASVIVPATTTVSSIFTVIAGTVVLDEHPPTEPLRLALCLGGTALAVLVLLPLGVRHQEILSRIEKRFSRLMRTTNFGVEFHRGPPSGRNSSLRTASSVRE